MKIGENFLSVLHIGWTFCWLTTQNGCRRSRDFRPIKMVFVKINSPVKKFSAIKKYVYLNNKKIKLPKNIKEKSSYYNFISKIYESFLL